MFQEHSIIILLQNSQKWLVNNVWKLLHRDIKTGSLSKLLQTIQFCWKWYGYLAINIWTVTHFFKPSEQSSFIWKRKVVGNWSNCLEKTYVNQLQSIPSKVWNVSFPPIWGPTTQKKNEWCHQQNFWSSHLSMVLCVPHHKRTETIYTCTYVSKDTYLWTSIGFHLTEMFVQTSYKIRASWEFIIKSR